MNDDSIMRFGAHKGKKLSDVPADYLIYAYENFELEHRPEFKKYLEENIDVLRKEAKENKTWNNG